ncbi:baseplate J/gp47 family protein [Streptomyces vinaceus]|uniref:hypothetical protein n=1 Tax=Streptomyces vinaceus TaxID=1960 RepID=UPI003676F60F
MAGSTVRQPDDVRAPADDRRSPNLFDARKLAENPAALQAPARMVGSLAQQINLYPGHCIERVTQGLASRSSVKAPARTRVAFELSPSVARPFVLPMGTEVATPSDAEEGVVVFSTVSDTILYPVQLVAAGTSPISWDVTDALAISRQFKALEELKADTAIGNDILLLLLSAAAPGMSLLVSADWTGSAQADGTWQTLQGGIWVDCPTDPAPAHPSGLAIAIPAGQDTVTIPAAGALPAMSQAALLRYRPGHTAVSLHSPAVSVVCRAIVPVSQGELIRDESIGVSSGSPGQVFPLKHSIVVTDHRPQIRSTLTNTVLTWSMVDSFAQSGPSDLHFMVDSQSRCVLFSPDRARGGVPPANATLAIAYYHSGGGSQGNVMPGALTVLRNPRPDIAGVVNSEAATGGADETPAAGTLRPSGPGDSIATARECESLLLNSGLGVACVQCIPPLPQETDTPRPVTLKVLLSAQGDSLGRLTPQQLALPTEAQHAIRDRLTPHLPVGVEVAVEAFGLTHVSSRVEIWAAEGLSTQDRTDLAGEAVKALHRYFSPFPGGAADGRGWPPGQTVYANDIYQALSRAAGISRIPVVALSPPGGGESTSIPLLEPKSGAATVLHSANHTITCFDFRGKEPITMPSSTSP